MIATGWDALHKQERHNLRVPSEHVTRFLAELAQGPAKGGRLLDIGCGHGRHMKLAAELGYKPEGIDTSPVALDSASQYGEVKRGDMTELPYPDASFDVALAVGSLYYTTPNFMRDAVQELRRILKPAGAGYVVCRTNRDWRYGMGDPSGRDCYRLDLPGHPEHEMTITFLTSAAITRMFVGFKFTRVELVEHTTLNRLRTDSDWHIAAIT